MLWIYDLLNKYLPLKAKTERLKHFVFHLKLECLEGLELNLGSLSLVYIFRRHYVAFGYAIKLDTSYPSFLVVAIVVRPKVSAILSC